MSFQGFRILYAYSNNQPDYLFLYPNCEVRLVCMDWSGWQTSPCNWPAVSIQYRVKNFCLQYGHSLGLKLKNKNSRIHLDYVMKPGLVHGRSNCKSKTLIVPMLNNGILWMLLALFIPEILQFQVPYRIINGYVHVIRYFVSSFYPKIVYR